MKLISETSGRVEEFRIYRSVLRQSKDTRPEDSLTRVRNCASTTRDTESQLIATQEAIISTERENTYQAQQNIVLELGMLLAVNILGLSCSNARVLLAIQCKYMEFVSD